MQDRDLILAIRSAYDSGIPNGWLLGWDRERFGGMLAKIADGFQCINVTSFDYSRCNTYIFESTCETDFSIVLTAKISFVLDVFVTYWTQYTPKRGRGHGGRVVHDVSESYAALEKNVADALCSAGFRRVPSRLYDAHVVGIELELSTAEDVTLGKCLFDDYDG